MEYIGAAYFLATNGMKLDDQISERIYLHRIKFHSYVNHSIHRTEIAMHTE